MFAIKSTHTIRKIPQIFISLCYFLSLFLRWWCLKLILGCKWYRRADTRCQWRRERKRGRSSHARAGRRKWWWFGSRIFGKQSIHEKTITEKEKKDDTIAKENYLLDQAVSVFRAKQDKKADPEDVFGQNVAVGLRAISDKRSRELAKLKIQEVLFHAQFGMLSIPLPENVQLQSTPISQSPYMPVASPIAMSSSISKSSLTQSTGDFENKDGASPGSSFIRL